MEVDSQNLYLSVVSTSGLPQGISMVPLSQLAVAFSEMAKNLRKEGAPAQQQEAFQAALVDTVNSAPHLTPDERAAVRNTIFTAFDGLPRNHVVKAVRAEFLRQVTFPRPVGRPGSSYGSAPARTRP
jgi:hypothetical protein